MNPVRLARSLRRATTGGEDGFALLFSFWMFTILLLLVMAHGFWMYQEIPLTFAYVDDVKARALAWSALHIAAGALLADLGSSDTPIGVVVNEVMIFGENRADVRINEVDDNGTPEFVEIYNNSDFAQEIGGWKLIDAGGGVHTLPAGETIRPGEAKAYDPSWAINDGNEDIYLVTDDGDTIDSVLVRVASSGGSWQILPDGSNGEYWAGQRLPSDPTSKPWRPGWVDTAPTQGTPNGAGEWILPGSVVWNRTTGESYVFQGSAGSETIAYWVPADSYFIVSGGATRSEFQTFFDFGSGKGDSTFPTPRILYRNTGAGGGNPIAVLANYDDSQTLADMDVSPTDSFLFPLTIVETPPALSADGNIDLLFFRPRNFTWRFRSETHVILAPFVPSPATLLGQGYNYTYGAIPSRATPYWRTFQHIAGDSTVLKGDYARAFGRTGASIQTDTYWNWMVPGDSSSLVVKGSFVDAYPTSNDWKDTFQAFSPYDNHAGGWEITHNGAYSGALDDPDSSDWWLASQLDPYFNRLHGSRADWDTYAQMSVGLAITEVYDARPIAAAAPANWATTLVVSEVGADVGASTDDYIEIYNPTASPISLTGKSLQRGTGAPGTVSVFPLPSVNVKAYSFYLVATGTGGGAMSPDSTHSALAVNDDDWVAIVSNTAAIGACNDADIIDLVGFGTGPCAEGTIYGNDLVTGNSADAIERKAYGTSTTATMASGGADELEGNGIDSNNNSADLVDAPGAAGSGGTPRGSTVTETPSWAGGATEKYDFVEFYNTYYDSRPAGSAWASRYVPPPWTGTRYGGGLKERDHAYEYIELFNTSNAPIDMANQTFQLSQDTASWAGGTLKYLRPWRAGDSTIVPAKGCALILPVDADTAVLKIPSGIALLGLSNVSSGNATDTQLGDTMALRNNGAVYFRIQNGAGTTWNLNFWGKTMQQGKPWGKTDVYVSDPTTAPGTLVSNWSQLSTASPGVCPGNVDHLLEDWATLTRNTTAGAAANDLVAIDVTDPSKGYIRIRVYDESGKLAFNQGDTYHLVYADTSNTTSTERAFANVPLFTPSPTADDVRDTYVTPMDLFYLDPDDVADNNGAAAAIRPHALKNFTVYADTVVNVNTADQYAGADEVLALSNAELRPDVNVLRAIIQRVTGDAYAACLDTAIMIVRRRLGPDERESTADDNICLSKNGIEQWFKDAGVNASVATNLAASGWFSVTSAGYFTVIGEGALFSDAGDTVGSRIYWAVFERGWSGRPAGSTTPTSRGSWRYWRDNWTGTNLQISNEGNFQSN